MSSYKSCPVQTSTPLGTFKKSSVARRAVAVALLLGMGLFISSCGYRPLYGRNNAPSKTVQNMADVNIAIIPNRIGQMLRTELKRRLTPYGPRGKALYSLNVKLREAIRKIAIDRASFATRANLGITADFELLRNRDNKVVSAGQPRAVASYNILTSDFATLAAKADAQKRVVKILAEDIQTRLAIYFLKPDPRGQATNR